MIGNGVDGTYYQQKGNEAILSSGGNGNPFGDLTYDGAGPNHEAGGRQEDRGARVRRGVVVGRQRRRP